MVLIKNYDAVPFNEKEVLRYAGCRDENSDVNILLENCKREISGKLFYKVCYLILNVNIKDNYCDFGIFGVTSKDLARNLDGCFKAVVFAATIGVGIDRLIAKYSAFSPANALMFDAIGTQQIEALCDLFCTDITNEFEMYAKPRFSPGYGDLSLSFQKEIFSVLNCQKHIGLTVTDSLIMSPSKSVTAIVGLSETKFCDNISRKCDACEDKECPFGSVL